MNAEINELENQKGNRNSKPKCVNLLKREKIVRIHKIIEL